MITKTEKFIHCIRYLSVFHNPFDIYLQKVLSGINRASTLRLSICILARDCASPANKNMEKLLALREFFAEIKIYIIENDSKDNTRKVLERYAKNYSCVTLYSLEDFKQSDNPIFRKILHSENKSLTQIRMQRMSMLRDMLLEKSKNDKTFSADVHMQFDIDMFYVSLWGILHSFNNYDDWDIMFANSRFFSFQHLSTIHSNLLFDSYALLPYHDTTKETLHSTIEYQMFCSQVTRYMPPYPVKSSFGGIGLYKGINLISYYENAEKDDFLYCEHVSAYKHLDKRIYINPAMITQLNSALSSWLMIINGGIFTYDSQALHIVMKILYFLATPFRLIRNGLKKLKQMS